MSRPRPGGPWDIGGLMFRVVPEEQAASSKRKGKDHVLLQVHNGGRWIDVKMEIGFALAGFFYNEEEALYPQADGYYGGEMYLERCRYAALYGHRKAAALTAEESRIAQERREEDCTF